jgi:hypothetical protein
MRETKCKKFAYIRVPLIYIEFQQALSYLYYARFLIRTLETVPMTTTGLRIQVVV